MTGDNETETTASALEISTGIPKDDVAIETDGDVLFDPETGEDVPIVSLQFGAYQCGVRATLSASEAEALCEELQDAIKKAHGHVEEFGQQGGGSDA